MIANLITVHALVETVAVVAIAVAAVVLALVADTKKRY